MKFLHIIPVQGTEDSIILQSTVHGSPFLFFLAQYVLFFWTAKSIIRGEHFRMQESHAGQLVQEMWIQESRISIIL